MAVETQAAAQPTHEGDPIVRDRLYIGGEWVEPHGSGTFEVVDATTEDVIGTVPAGDGHDVDAAVRAARPAFEQWSQASPHERADACQAIGAKLAERSEGIALLVSREVGMPLNLSAMIQAGLPAMDFSSMPAVVEETQWEEQVGNSLIVREPVGVVGCITPWNYPLHQVCAKVAPALAAGCAVIVKPSEGKTLSDFLIPGVLDGL